MFRFLTLTFFTPELGCRSGQFLTGSESRILIKKTRINFILPFNEVLHVNDVIQNLLTFTLYKYKDLDPQKFNFREKQDFHKFGEGRDIFRKENRPLSSVADPERFDADADPTFQADADPDPDPNPFTRVRNFFFFKS